MYYNPKYMMHVPSEKERVQEQQNPSPVKLARAIRFHCKNKKQKKKPEIAVVFAISLLVSAN